MNYNEVLGDLFKQNQMPLNNENEEEEVDESPIKGKRRKGKMGTCVECKERKLCCARNMCNACYIRVVAKPNKKEQECEICGEVKKQFARGVCNACYIRVYKNPKKTEKICSECNESKKLFSRGLCNACYIRLHVRNKKKEIVCGECAELKPRFSRGLCNACYIRLHVKPKRDYNKRQTQQSYCLNCCCQMDSSELQELEGLCRTCTDKQSDSPNPSPSSNSFQVSVSILDGELCKCHRCHMIVKNFGKGFCKKCYNEFVAYLNKKNGVESSTTQQILEQSNQQIKTKYKINAPGEISTSGGVEKGASTIEVKQELMDECSGSDSQVGNVGVQDFLKVKEEPMEEYQQQQDLEAFLNELAKEVKQELADHVVDGDASGGDFPSSNPTTTSTLPPLDQPSTSSKQHRGPKRIFQGISPEVARSLTYKPNKEREKNKVRNIRHTPVEHRKELLAFINKRMKEKSRSLMGKDNGEGENGEREKEAATPTQSHQEPSNSQTSPIFTTTKSKPSSLLQPNNNALNQAIQQGKAKKVPTFKIIRPSGVVANQEGNQPGNSGTVPEGNQPGNSGTVPEGNQPGNSGTVPGGSSGKKSLSPEEGSSGEKFLSPETSSGKNFLSPGENSGKKSLSPEPNPAAANFAANILNANLQAFAAIASKSLSSSAATSRKNKRQLKNSSSPAPLPTEPSKNEANKVPKKRAKKDDGEMSKETELMLKAYQC